MPLVRTRDFGEVDCGEESVIEFPLGLPAFETESRFVAIEQPDTAPLVFLQSLATPALCFATMPVFSLDPAYELALSAEERAAIGLPDGREPAIGRDLACLAVLTLPETGAVTANLLAPVVVNLEARRAVQAVRSDARYSHRQPVAGDAAC